MSMTWIEDAESQQHLGPSGIIQASIGQPGLSDYSSGGYAILPASFGMSRIRGLMQLGFTGTGTGGGYQAEYNKTTNKLMFFQQSAATGALTELPAGTDLSANTYMFLAYGF